jgi:peptidoglycan/LPS O-acetylase OafA/YrhL
MPALDGLRGLAVAAVVAFHTGHLRGGWLGVDMFFVLSGFLITGLLLKERTTEGTISLPAFWRRRALRLLPALAFVLVAVAVYARWYALPRELHQLRVDVVSTLTYSANWVSVAGHRGYWARYALPSPLEHTWSLAIEEQFYLLWPLVVVAVLGRRAARPRVRALAVVCAAGALVSVVVALALAFAGADPSRLYAGTDTRASALLFGAFAAVVAALHGPIRSGVARGAWQIVAVGGATLIAVAMVELDGQRDLVYRGGLVLCSLAAASIVWSVTQPDPGLLGRLLSWRPLRALGAISYGVYLWHWPVIVFLRPPRSHVTGWPLTILQVGCTLALATLSYFVIERPLRTGGLRAWRRESLAPAAGAFAAVAALVATSVAPASAAAITAPPLITSTVPVATTSTVAPSPMSPIATTTTIALTGAIARPVDRPARVLVVGDSVAQSLAVGLQSVATEQSITVDDKAAPYCSLSYDDDTWYRPKGRKPAKEPTVCATVVRGWPEAVASFQPDAVVLLYGRAQIDDRLVTGSWLDPCDPAYLAWYRALTERAVTDLGANGATVFVVTAPPHRVFQLRNGDEGSACVNGALRALVAAKADPRVRLVDLDAWVCPAGVCIEKVDGVILREEGLHFDHGGGIITARWLIAQMYRPPDPAQ